MELVSLLAAPHRARNPASPRTALEAPQVAAWRAAVHPPATSRPRHLPVRRHRPIRASASAAAAAEPSAAATNPDSPSSGSSSSSSSEALTGVVIVDHGSRRAESNSMLLEFVDLYKSSSGRTIVEAAHMELAEPSVAAAVAACVAAGARRVVVAPYFLSRGRHIQEDIPALVAEAAAQHPGVECVIAEPIGIDALMAQLIENRVRAASRADAPPST